MKFRYYFSHKIVYRDGKKLHLGFFDCLLDAAESPPPFAADAVTLFEFIDLCQFFTKFRRYFGWGISLNARITAYHCLHKTQISISTNDCSQGESETRNSNTKNGASLEHQNSLQGFSVYGIPLVPCQCRHTISQRTTNKNYATLHTVV
jgi:hypothetical protein